MFQRVGIYICAEEYGEEKREKKRGETEQGEGGASYHTSH
jgi:hypothetical protein